MIFDSLGLGEMGVVLMLAIILIEPKKLGKVMKEFGKFKRKVSKIQADVKSQLDAITLEEDAREKSEITLNQKAGMRQWGRDQVKALTAHDRAMAAQTVLEKIVAWPTYTHAKVVACFAGTLTEIDTEPLLQRILADGKILLLPYIEPAQGQNKADTATNNPDTGSDSQKILGMAVVTNLDQDLMEGAFGIREPQKALRKGEEAPIPDLVFVPGSCFDQRGGRLGQGMGFYDRYLASVKTLRAGLSFDVQIAEKNLALDPHDQFMDVLISEKRFMVFSAPAGSAALGWNSAET